MQVQIFVLVIKLSGCHDQMILTLWFLSPKLNFMWYAVVWNPWDKKAKALSDLGDEDYKTMLCMDSAAVETPIGLKPFEEWKGRQELSAVSSSYFSGQLDPRKVLLGIS